VKKYLLDTNICIFYIKGLYELNKKIELAGEQNCFISEITVAELKFGIENSNTIALMRIVVEEFIKKFPIIPIYSSIDIYAKQKAILRKQGLIIDDFYILIGATAIANKMIMVTNNIKHFNRLQNIVIEDWTIATKNNM
jgi:tRNA(fMet)-specific endonuclease VapC